MVKRTPSFQQEVEAGRSHLDLLLGRDLGRDRRRDRRCHRHGRRRRQRHTLSNHGSKGRVGVDPKGG